MTNEYSEPFYRLLKGTEDLFTFFNTEFLDPRKGLEVFICPGIIILGNIHNMDAPFGTSDRGLLNDFQDSIIFQGE